jgi:hypothetical protein
MHAGLLQSDKGDAMPICEADPWRKQYFEDVPCPDDVRVPTEDGDAWAWYPKYKWVYNKLEIAERQGFVCGPHGLQPPTFPVFSKPIFNMRGMGAGSRIVRTLEEFEAFQRPGHIWMPLLTGEHVSSDAAVVNGKVCWWRHSIGKPLKGGMFDYWTVLTESLPDVEAYCGSWIENNLAGYTGMLNLETIGAKIIEVHLRFSDQWPDLYGGRPWVEALIRLYQEGSWRYDDSNRRTGYSVVLFGAHGVRFTHPPKELIDEIEAMPEVTSAQITFHEEWPPSWHSMPPGGFRLAIVNTWNLETGIRARERLALNFWSTQQLYKPRRRARSMDKGSEATP